MTIAYLLIWSKCSDTSTSGALNSIMMHFPSVGYNKISGLLWPTSIILSPNCLTLYDFSSSVSSSLISFTPSISILSRSFSEHPSKYKYWSSNNHKSLSLVSVLCCWNIRLCKRFSSTLPPCSSFSSSLCIIISKISRTNLLRAICFVMLVRFCNGTNLTKSFTSWDSLSW